jgi:hypothetical protein
MKNFLAILSLVFVVACAQNPLRLAEGMWVKHKIDGQKYYIIDINLIDPNQEGTTGYVRIKNESGEEVDGKFPIHEFDRWVETVEVDNSALLAQIVLELQNARIALDEANTIANREAVESAIDNGEDAVTAESPIFRQKTWNPVTKRYE